MAAGLKFAIPSITKEMSSSHELADGLSAIPYVFGLFSSLGVSYFSDKLSNQSSDRSSARYPFVVSCFTCITCGFIIIILVVEFVSSNLQKTAGVVVGMSLVTIGIFPITPLVGSWATPNLESPTLRAVGLGYVLTIGGFGGLAGSFIYREKESPHYRLGFVLSLVFSVLGVGLATLVYYSCKQENREKDRSVANGQDETTSQRLALGTKSVRFRWGV